MAPYIRQAEAVPNEMMVKTTIRVGIEMHFEIALDFITLLLYVL